MTTFAALPVAAIAAGSLALAVATFAQRERWLPSGVSQPRVVAWEHGFKTDRVIATRYGNPRLGYNIGFNFPQNENEADRTEISDFFEAHGGNLFQGGGYPGATAYVAFKDVADADSANKKLREILPELSQVITDLGNGKVVKITLPKPKYEWPDTAPPDKSDPYWEFNGNLGVNGTSYLRRETAPGKWQWVVNEEAMRRMKERETSRRVLYQALRTRRLSDDEMKQALAYGDGLNIEPMVGYKASDKAAELNDAWLTQNRIRLLTTN